MTNNRYLKIVSIAENLQDNQIRAMMLLGGYEPSKNEVKSYLYSPDNKSYRECPEPAIEAFCNGWIEYKRGKKDDKNSKKNITKEAKCATP